MKNISSLSQHEALPMNQARGGKHITYMGIVTIRHLEIMPEMRTKGPKQSILRTVDCGVLPQVPCSISTDE